MGNRAWRDWVGIVILASSFCLGGAGSALAQEGLQIMRAVELQLDTLAGKSYELQSSGNLQDWTFEEQIIGTGTPSYRLKSLRASEQRYYRLVPMVVRPPDYFPLSVGNRWVYDGGYGNGNRVDTVLALETIAGRQTYKWQRQEAAPDNYIELRWLFQEDGALMLAQLWGSEGGLPSPVPFPSPWTWVKAKPALLETWTNQADVGLIQAKTTLTVYAVGVEITTPAGVFSDCLVLRLHFEIAQGGLTQHSYAVDYYAPNVGLVRTDDCQADWQVKHSQRLVEYTIKGN